MSSFHYSILKSFRSFAPSLVSIEGRQAGLKSYKVTVVEKITHQARVEAADEKKAWQKFILHQFVERFRQVRSEMSDVSIQEESAP